MNSRMSKFLSSLGPALILISMMGVYAGAQDGPGCNLVLGGKITLEEGLNQKLIPPFYAQNLGGPFVLTYDMVFHWEMGIYSQSNTRPLRPRDYSPTWAANEIQARVYGAKELKPYAGVLFAAEVEILNLDFKSQQNQFLIVGGPGYGKTFFLFRVAQYAIEQGMKVGILPLSYGFPISKQPLKETSLDLNTEFYDMSGGQFEHFKIVDLLIVDDFIQSGPSIEMAKKIQRILEYRVAHDLPTLITMGVGSRNRMDQPEELANELSILPETRKLFSNHYRVINKNRQLMPKMPLSVAK